MEVFEEFHKIEKLFEATKGDNDIVTLCTTVVTGFEWQAVDECRQKLESSIRVVKERGKIYFNVSLKDFHKVLDLRSIDNIFIIGDVRKLLFTSDNHEHDMNLIKKSVIDDMNLKKYLDAWGMVTHFPGNIYPSMEDWKKAAETHQEKPRDDEEASRKGRRRGCDPSHAEDHNVLSFRVTCERTGKHSFNSNQVATVVGGELQDKYHWVVDLTMYELEVVCKVTKDEIILNLRVTHESKHRRNIAHFGPTTLRATVCYNLLRLAHPKLGDIVIDPMCGGGSIPIEAALAFPETYVLCGDIHDKAVERSKLNFDALDTRHKIDLLQWSVVNLPFTDSFVDVIVTDMPFGKRSGNKLDNRVLYKKYLVELARVARLKLGRVVLLTNDRRSISMALSGVKDLFHTTKMLGINMGGLRAAVYVLKRTNILYEEFIIRPKEAREPFFIKDI